LISCLLVLALSCISVLPHYSLYAQDSKTDYSSIDSEEKAAVYKEEIDKQSDASKGGEIAMSTILMFATVLMAPFFALSCPKKPSALIFVGGALFFIGVEIYSWATYKSASNRLMEVYDNTAEADKQIESLNTAGQQTLEAANKAQLKGNFAMGVAIIWGVASAVAFIEGAIGIFNPDFLAPCTGKPVTFHQDKNEYYSFDNQYIDSNIISKSISLKEIVETMKKGRNDLESYVLLKEKNRFFDGALKSMSIDDYQEIKNKDLLSFEKQKNISKLSHILSEILDTMVPSAHAQEETSDTDDSQNTKAMASGISFGLTGATLAIIFAAVPKIKGALMGAYSNPFVRGAIFAAFAGFAGGATALIKEGAGKLEKQANQYFNLVTQLQQANSQITLKTGINQQAQAPIIKPMSSNAAAVALTGQCFTGGRGKIRTDSSCSCKSSKSCKTSGMPTIKFEGFKTPNTLKNLVNTNGQMTDQFYKGNVQGANMMAEANNNKNAARLKKLNKSIQGSVNSLLKKAGKKPYDFDKEISNQKTALASTFRDGYSSLSGDMKNKIFSFDKDKKIMDRKEPVSTRGSGASGAVKSSSSSGSKVKSKSENKGGDFKFDFDLDDEEEEKEKGMGHKDEGTSEENELDQYETTQDDVSQRSETNIFKIIETRYLKTAYPIFFEEEEEESSK